MSYRVCSKCDYVINNTIHHEDDCPKCGSKKMVDPLEDDRNWDELYEKQKKRNMNKITRFLIEGSVFLWVSQRIMKFLNKLTEGTDE